MLLAFLIESFVCVVLSFNQPPTRHLTVQEVALIKLIFRPVVSSETFSLAFTEISAINYVLTSSLFSSLTVGRVALPTAIINNISAAEHA